MWLFTTQGFYSVVADRDDPERVLVRARAREDIEALRRQIPGIEPFSEPGSDYRWRAFVLRSEWEEAISRLAAEIDYDNFKNAVADRQGYGRSHLYMEVWQALLKLQQSGEE